MIRIVTQICIFAICAQLFFNLRSGKKYEKIGRLMMELMILFYTVSTVFPSLVSLLQTNMTEMEKDMAVIEEDLWTDLLREEEIKSTFDLLYDAGKKIEEGHEADINEGDIDDIDDIERADINNEDSNKEDFGNEESGKEDLDNESSDKENDDGGIKIEIPEISVEHSLQTQE